MYLYSHRWLRMVFRIYNSATGKPAKTWGRQWLGQNQSSELPESPA